MVTKSKLYDVVVCGGGLAGLTLARQLRLQMPELSVLALDKTPRPLPEAGFKVGESTVIIGAAYLQQIVKLGDYLARSHIQKLGLRYFFPALGRGESSFAKRPEMGRANYDPRTTEWQIDRGIFENDLRRMVEEENGVELLEGASVTAIDLSCAKEPHRIRFKLAGEGGSVRASWVIDATGRRRLLRQKLRLSRKTQGLQCSAAWFRIKGRVDVSDLVPASEERWHARVPGNHPQDESYGRYNSTNHLLGKGYWVWLIPLSSGYTSIGIVALEEVHPCSSYNTYERASQWLRAHEPELARLLADDQPLDFLVRKNYSYSTERVLSADRWACTGDSGAFPDPFYSPGADSIAFTNCMICEMIAQDRLGKLSAEMCDQLNGEYLSWVDKTTHNIHSGYSLWGDPVVGALKIIWDLNNFWLSGPRFYSMLYQPGFSEKRAGWIDAELGKQLARMLELRKVVLRFFHDWIGRRPGRASFDWIDYFGDLDFIHQGALTISTPKENPRQDLLSGCRRLEEIAQSLFLIALEDVMPDELQRLQHSGRADWLNAWAISLDKDRWEDDGLFRPESAPRDLWAVHGQLRNVFKFQDV